MENTTSLNKEATPTPNVMLSEVFSLFTSHQILRPVMSSPFEINGKVYATDGFTLIRCDKSYCNFEITNPHTPPDCEAIMPTPNTESVLNIDKSVFEQYKTEDEYENIGEEIECKTCSGFGNVEWVFEGYTKDDDCPVCKGSGLEAEPQSVKTGRKTFGRLKVKLNETYFIIDHFYLLIKVRDILGGDITLLHQSKPTSPVLFKIGFCEILIMPCTHTDFVDTEEVLAIL